MGSVVETFGRWIAIYQSPFQGVRILAPVFEQRGVELEQIYNAASACSTRLA
jgi:hypothetical protein